MCVLEKTTSTSIAKRLLNQKSVSFMMFLHSCTFFFIVLEQINSFFFFFFPENFYFFLNENVILSFTKYCFVN